jgi:phosphomannomutase
LPTRDAFLPILAVLLRAREEGASVSALFDQLPRRFSRAALLKNFSRATSRRIVARFTPPDEQINSVSFQSGTVSACAAGGQEISLPPAKSAILSAIRDALEQFFTPELGFGSVIRLNYTDGVRAYFANDDVAHVRPSGNADELRIYAVANTQARADAIAKAGVAEPDGILRQLERAVNEAPATAAGSTPARGGAAQP